MLGGWTLGALAQCLVCVERTQTYDSLGHDGPMGPVISYLGKLVSPKTY